MSLFLRNFCLPICLYAAMPIMATNAHATSNSAHGNTNDIRMHQVQRGETIASILRSYGFDNLWGAGGVVAQTIELNQNRLNNPRALEPGDWILVPASTQQALHQKQTQKTSIARQTKSESITIVCNDNKTATYTLSKQTGNPTDARLELSFEKIAKLCSEPSQSRSIASENDEQIEFELVDGFMQLKPVEPVPELPHVEFKDVKPEPEKKFWVFKLGPQAGYLSQTYYQTADIYSGFQGPVYKALGSIDWGTKKWRFGFEGFYGQAFLGNLSVTSDKATQSELGVQLTGEFQKWLLFLGTTDSKLRSSTAGDSLNTSGSFYQWGLGRNFSIDNQWKLSARVSTYSGGFRKNDEFLNPIGVNGLQGLIAIQYAWGGEK